ncbi:unnamed protein product [Ectocarpus sp. 8 AP-2014]
MRYFMLHKPRGCVTSTVDDTGRGRPTVYDVAKAAGVPNFGPVGRLDFDTSGVLLFTDDYKLKKAISSPTYKGKAAVGTVPSMEKVYHLLVAGTITPEDEGMGLLQEPLHFNRKLDGPGGSWTKPAEARVLLTKTFKAGQPVPWRFKPGTIATITWIEVVLREGKNRQIRRLCRRSEFELTRLHRISVGPIVLGDVEEGSCRELTRQEVEALYKRCLPKDPLCPTIDAVQDILKSRLSQTARRIRTTAEVGGHRFKAREHSSAMDVPQKDAPDRPTAEDAEQRRAAKARDGERGCPCRTTQGPGRRRAKAFATEEDLASIVKRLIDFTRRDLHETPAGPDGESAGPDYCPGEKESLAQARAVPPNETHMVCGYRSSQIERLGLTYGTM